MYRIHSLTQLIDEWLAVCCLCVCLTNLLWSDVFQSKVAFLRLLCVLINFFFNVVDVCLLFGDDDVVDQRV